MSKKFWKRIGLSLLIILIVLNITVFKIMQSYLESRGEGNMRLTLSGVEVKTLTYQHGSKRVQLIGMMHIADESFFRDIVKSIPVTRSVVLLEGVDDAAGVAGKALDYSRLARWLGTSYQDKSFDQDIKKEHSYRYADVSVKDLSPESRHFLELLAKEADVEKRLGTLFDDNFDQEEWERAEASFQRDRNAKLLRTFDEVAPQYEVIAIPWGVTHLNDFALAMEARGYQLVEAKSRKAINFWW